MTSLETGVTCKLTQKKPEFETICPSINLDQKFQEKLEDVVLELARINRNKNSVHRTFYILMIIGFLLIIGSSVLSKWTYSTIYFWVYKMHAIGLGIASLTVAYYKLNRFRQKLNTARNKKNKIDLVLEKYGISYTTVLDFEQKVHGTQDVNISIKFKNWTKKHTTTMWNIKS